MIYCNYKGPTLDCIFPLIIQFSRAVGYFFAECKKVDFELTSYEGLNRCFLYHIQIEIDQN